jgi:predicted RNA binding protein YcfA (HicA-like mRNA interferase family)
MAGVGANVCGSHRQDKHATKPGTVTIAGNENHDLATGTWNSILKQAGIRGELE